MKKKVVNFIFYFSTISVSINLLIGSYLYLTLHPRIVNAFSNTMVEGFNAIRFPSWLITPMGIAKFLGVVALWAPIPKWLREWAYAGIFFNLTLAIGAHVFNPLNTEDNNFIAAIPPLTFLLISRYTLFLNETSNLGQLKMETN